MGWGQPVRVLLPGAVEVLHTPRSVRAQLEPRELPQESTDETLSCLTGPAMSFRPGPRPCSSQGLPATTRTPQNRRKRRICTTRHWVGLEFRRVLFRSGGENAPWLTAVSSVRMGNQYSSVRCDGVMAGRMPHIPPTGTQLARRYGLYAETLGASVICDHPGP